MQEVQELLTSDEAWGALYSYFRPYDIGARGQYHSMKTAGVKILICPATGRA